MPDGGAFDPSQSVALGGCAGLIIGAALLQLYYWLRRHWGD